MGPEYVSVSRSMGPNYFNVCQDLLGPEYANMCQDIWVLNICQCVSSSMGPEQDLWVLNMLMCARIYESSNMSLCAICKPVVP